MIEKLLESSDGAVVLQPTWPEHRIEPFIPPDNRSIRAHRYKALSLGDFIGGDHFDELNRRQDTVLICVHMFGRDRDWNRSALNAQAKAIQAAVRKSVPLCFVFVRAPGGELATPMDSAAVRSELPNRLADAIAKCPDGLFSGSYTIGTSSALRARATTNDRYLHERLRADSIRQAIVLGQQRDVCVAATVFGDPRPRPSPLNVPKQAGLLDLQLQVITAYDVLIGTGTPIGYYKFAMTDKLLGAGAAVKSALKAATSAPTKAALSWPFG